MKKRKDKLCEKKIWVPLPPEEVEKENKSSASIRYNKIKNVWEKRKSFYNKDKRLLGIEVTEMQDQINKGTYVLDNDSTFEQNIRKWFSVHAVTKEDTTRESYETYMNHAIKLLGLKKIQEIKPMDIKEAYNSFLYKIDECGNKTILHSKNSLKHLHFVVNMSLKFSVENTILFKNPCDALNKKEFKPDKFEPYVYTQEEFDILLEKIKGEYKIETIVILGGGVGLRAGEICGLKWADIDSEDLQISIKRARYRTKGKVGEKDPKTELSKRVISVDQYIIDVLKSHPNDSEYVLCRKTKKPFRNDEIYHIFVEFLEKNNLPETRLHDLRHYNATMMAYYEIDIKTASKRLGDNPETVLKIYQHVLEKMDRGAADKLGGMFKKETELPVVTSVVNDKKEEDSSTTVIAENPLLN